MSRGVLRRASPGAFATKFYLAVAKFWVPGYSAAPVGSSSIHSAEATSNGSSKFAIFPPEKVFARTKTKKCGCGEEKQKVFARTKTKKFSPEKKGAHVAKKGAHVACLLYCFSGVGRVCGPRRNYEMVKTDCLHVCAR